MPDHANSEIRFTASPPRSPTVFRNGGDRRIRTGRVLYRGRTWSVTSYGIERATGHRYDIERNRLLEQRGTLLDWPLHIARKGEDYDFEDFLCCYVKAFEIFSVDAPNDLLVTSIEAAIAERERHLGDALRRIRRSHLEEPIRAELQGSLGMALIAYSVADMVFEPDWRAAWDRPDPTLVNAANRERGNRRQQGGGVAPTV